MMTPSIVFASENAYLSSKDALIFASSMQKDIPSSYKYISLRDQSIAKDSEFADAMKKLIYLDKVPNTKISPKFDLPIQRTAFEHMVQKLVAKDFVLPVGSGLFLTQADLDYSALWYQTFKSKKQLPTELEQIELIYSILQKSHVDHDSFDPELLKLWAIKGLTDATGDKYTQYYPPIESSNYQDELEWEYEWIGAYVDMVEPGKLIIVTPMVDSPAEKAGLRWWDHVTHVDGVEILEQHRISEVVSWIKWPSGSSVILTVERETVPNPLEIEVIRWTIILQDIESEKKWRRDYYIRIKNFGQNVDQEFKKSLKEIQEDSSVKKIIIDVRNNPGGYLGKVSSVLSNFVPAWEANAVVKAGEQRKTYDSLWYETLDLNDYKVIILQNTWSASASEIMTGTLKDYFPNITIMWERSFGKGSVQTLRSFSDGSTLKYTTARWFTGKTEQWIDGVGIEPDIIVEFDKEKFDKTWYDNQLEEALRY